MTNQELYDLCMNLTENEKNIFNKYCELYQHQEEYKETEYYKCFPNTTIFDAYQLFDKELGALAYLLKDVKAYIPEIIGSLQNVFDLGSLTKDMDADTKLLFNQLLVDTMKRQ